MKRLATLIVLLVLLAPCARASTTFVNSSTCGASNGCTTSGVSMTGANLLIGFVGFYSGTISVSDSSSNTWSSVSACGASSVDANVKGQFFYVISPTVSGSQTFTVSASNQFTGVVFAGFTTSGAATFGTSTCHDGGFGASNSTTSIGASGDFVLSGLNHDGSATSPAIGSSFSGPIDKAYAGGTNEGAHIGYKDATGAEAPVWSWTGSVTNAGLNINFTIGGAGGGTVAVPSLRLLGVGR